MHQVNNLTPGARYRRRRWALAAITIVVIVLAVFAVAQAAQQALRTPRALGQGMDAGRVATAPEQDHANSGQDREITAEDGLIRKGEQVDARADVPAVMNLDESLRDALRRASKDAAADGAGVLINSAWRSAAYQDQLLSDATAKYGSAEEAARWVATANESAHVSGDAVDLGPARALEWLKRHGAGYGLCQIYGNEPWHYELRPSAVDEGCPEMFDDPQQKRETGR